MPGGYKKIYFIIFLTLVFFAAVLIWQIKKNSAIETERASRPLIENVAIEIPLTPADPIFGNQGAPITIIEFLDLNRDADLIIHREIKNFVAKHPTEIRLFWRDFPAMSWYGADKNKLPRAARCIARQDKAAFWNFIDDISAYKKPSDEEIVAVAGKYLRDRSAWEACVSSQDTENEILNSAEFVTALGLKKSPVIFMNNKLINYVEEIDLSDLLKQLTTPLPNS